MLAIVWYRGYNGEQTDLDWLLERQGIKGNSRLFGLMPFTKDRSPRGGLGVARDDSIRSYIELVRPVKMSSW